MFFFTMLSLPDFKEKKILLVHSKGGVENNLKFKNSNIVLYKDGKKIDQISCYLVLAIYILGETTLTSNLIKQAKKFGISIFLLNYSFKTYAEIMAQAEGNYKLRHIQYNATREKQIEISKYIVQNKVENQIKLIKKLHKKNNVIEFLAKSIWEREGLKSLLGVEGIIASQYFPKIFEEIGWYRRAPRTKEDIPNLLLDIGYTFLFNYVDSILRLFGFDTYKGYYHQLFYMRKSLSCDLMEPMRPLVDKELIKAYNLKKINEKDFKFSNGSFEFKDPKLVQKYTSIWFKMIMNNREEIYEYIHSFYKYILNPDKYKYKFFEIKL